MKAYTMIQLLNKLNNENTIVSKKGMDRNLVCGVLKEDSIYMKMSNPQLGIADAVLVEGTKYVFLYLIEE